MIHVYIATTHACVPTCNAGVDATGVLGVPRVLWEGGYLWKFPYTSNGVPQKRWVQIKSINGGQRAKGTQEQPMVCEPLTLQWLQPGKVRTKDFARGGEGVIAG